ncbi:uncharacterized protein [Penaeus vannamei]|uniref:uncharacterized protein n=1 Tax=Penaeus vannamei TaxID=6689 RepID=UPI00387F7CA8
MKQSRNKSGWTRLRGGRQRHRDGGRMGVGAGTPVRMGTPLWALYRYSSNDYEQEPTTSSSSSSSGDCAFLDKTRFLFMDDGDCDSAKAAICQLLPGASASAGNSEPQPKRRPRRRQ